MIPFSANYRDAQHQTAIRHHEKSWRNFPGFFSAWRAGSSVGTPPKFHMEPQNTPLEKERQRPKQPRFGLNFLVFGGASDGNRLWEIQKIVTYEFLSS